MCNISDCFIKDMDASNENKLSRHMIFRIKNKALRNYTVAKALFMDIQDHVHPTSILYINPKEASNKKILFMDTTVYTKNRHFRLYQSHKGDGRFLFFPGIDKPGDVPDEKLFFQSSVTFFTWEEHEKMKLLDLTLQPNKRIRKIQEINPNRPRKKQATDVPWIATSLEKLFRYPVYKTVRLLSLSF